MSASHFHSGEVHLQNKSGERAVAKRNGRFISPRITPNGAAFLLDQQCLNLALTDGDGQIWSSFVIGRPGFIRANHEKEAQISLEGVAAPDLLRKILGQTNTGDDVGIVVMDLTRPRRLRLNGKLNTISKNLITIDIEQTCPNCPKYIQTRRPEARQMPYDEITPTSGTGFPSTYLDLIQTADTFYIASRHPDGTHDASHRGGNPGFITVKDGQLYIPDYSGNSMFMTLGNLWLHPYAGLTFIDFETGRQLNMSGSVEIDLTDERPSDGQSGRFWRFTPRLWHMARFRPDPGWTLVAYSKFNPS